MTAIKLYDIISFTTPVILLTGVVLGGIRYRNGNGVVKLVFWYFVAMLCLEGASTYYGYIAQGKNNLVWLSVNGLIHLLFFARLYDRHYGVASWPMRFASTIGVAAVLLNIVYYQPHKALASMQLYDVVVSDTIILVYTLFSTFHLLSGKAQMDPEIIRINTITLLYFSIDFLVALSMNFLIVDELSYNIIYFWLIRLVLLITLYLVLLYTLWRTGKNRKHLHYG